MTALGDFVYILNDGNLIQRLKPAKPNEGWHVTNFEIWANQFSLIHESEELSESDQNLLAMCPFTKTEVITLSNIKFGF